MALRVFPSLCLRARQLGAKRLVFTANLDRAIVDLDSGVGEDDAWSCVAGGSDDDSIGIANGRTGEEALRMLVDKLERGHS